MLRMRINILSSILGSDDRKLRCTSSCWDFQLIKRQSKLVFEAFGFTFQILVSVVVCRRHKYPKKRLLSQVFVKIRETESYSNKNCFHWYQNERFYRCNYCDVDRKLSKLHASLLKARFYVHKSSAKFGNNFSALSMLFVILNSLFYFNFSSSALFSRLVFATIKLWLSPTFFFPLFR